MTRNDLTIPKLAQRWQCSTKFVRRKIDARLLENVVRLGRNHMLIPLDSVEEYERRQTIAGARRPIR